MLVQPPLRLTEVDYRVALGLSSDARRRGDRHLALLAARAAWETKRTPRTWLALGQVLRDAANYDLARHCYKESLALDDSYVSNRYAYTALVTLLRDSGHPRDLQTARYHARRITQENPNDLIAQDTLAAIERRIRRYVRFHS